MKKTAWGIGLFFVGVLAAYFFTLSFNKTRSVPPPFGEGVRGRDSGAIPSLALSRPPATLSLKGEGTSLTNEKTSHLKKELLAQLNQKESSARSLEIPSPPPEEPVEAKPASTPKPLSADEVQRAAGRKKREGLPMGVVLWDGVPVYESKEGGKIVFEMQTGDLVRVFSDEHPDKRRVQPGLDVYLAATTKEVMPAGVHLPDRDGWVDKSALQVFEPQAAKEFLFELDPVTLGNDPTYSTLAFYERAMKNSDPVVHRVVGPRLIAIADLHEDYVSSWSALYRDRDSKVRAAALSALRKRGVANNREIIEDLIKRLSELTQTRAAGETEAEVLSILDILKAAHHPRVPAALKSFAGTWQESQNAPINQAVGEILR